MACCPSGAILIEFTIERVVNHMKPQNNPSAQTVKSSVVTYRAIFHIWHFYLCLFPTKQTNGLCCRWNELVHCSNDHLPDIFDVSKLIYVNVRYRTCKQWFE